MKPWHDSIKGTEITAIPQHIANLNQEKLSIKFFVENAS